MGGREEAFFVNVAVSNLKKVAIVYVPRYASAGIFDVECVERILGGQQVKMWTLTATAA